MTKLSDFPVSGTPPATVDRLVGVTSGNADVLYPYSVPQHAETEPPRRPIIRWCSRTVGRGSR